MNQQIEISFSDESLLFGKHSLRYHLLRLGEGKLKGKVWHVNSVWEGYNSDGYPKEPIDGRLHKYHAARSIEDVRSIIKEAATDEVKAHYIMATFDYEQVTSMMEFLK